jgi:hypothetical protein
MNLMMPEQSVYGVTALGAVLLIGLMMVHPGGKLIFMLLSFRPTMGWFKV